MLYMVTFTINIPQMLAYIITIHGSYGLYPMGYITRDGPWQGARCDKKMTVRSRLRRLPRLRTQAMRCRCPQLLVA